MISFSWDPSKNLNNQRKHGVSFEEAQTVFFDDNAFLEYDEAHSLSENRFRILGMSMDGNLLLVVHCIREEELIRIISARHATSTEQHIYERSLGL